MHGAQRPSPWTKDLKHLLPVPKKWGDNKTTLGAVEGLVKTKDRIKWLNIVPVD